MHALTGWNQLASARLRSARVPAIALLVALGGCSEGVSAPVPLPSDPPPAQNQLVDGPVPLPSPWPRVLGKPGRLVESFQRDLSEWKDVREDGHSYAWLYPGRWVTTPQGLLHDEIMKPPALSFRRYAGKAFGTPDGELPLRYRVQLTVTPIEAHPQNFPPVGDLGIPVYYLDPLHYVEVVFKPEKLEIWACDGGLPMKWRGWHPLYETPMPTRANQARGLLAEVDTETGMVTVSVDGRVVASVRHGMIQPISHYVALRATGNRMRLSDLRLESD